MKESELRTRAKTLGLKIISVCDTIDTKKGRGVLVNQIIRSSTSIGANIYEANYASSKADVIIRILQKLNKKGKNKHGISRTDIWMDNGGIDILILSVQGS